MQWHHLYINFYFVFWHSNHKLNAFFTPTWVWEVIPNPVAVSPFVHFVWPYENTAVAKAIRLRPCWEKFQNTFQNIPQSCVEAWSACYPTIIQRVFIMAYSHCDLSGICWPLLILRCSPTASMGSIKASIKVIISYGSLKILQCSKPTPNYLSPHADHSKNNVGIEISCYLLGLGI